MLVPILYIEVEHDSTCVCVLAGSNCGDTAPHCLHDCMRGLSIDRVPVFSLS